MQIAINVSDAIVASKILAYLKKFKQEEVLFETFENTSFETYMQSEQFQKDKDSLRQTLTDITSEKSKLSTMDANFWREMDKVIESA